LAGQLSLGRRQSHGRPAFALVIGTSWLVGLFGLERSRISSFQLPLVIGAGLLAYGLVGALRRRLEDSRDRVMPSSGEAPRTCVIVRRFGEGRNQEVAPAATVDAPALADRSPTASPPIELVRVEASHAPAQRRSLDYIPLTRI
jgi:hypothetical protein